MASTTRSKLEKSAPKYGQKYEKICPTGGKLIREVIAFVRGLDDLGLGFDSKRLQSSIGSDILIACSGGLDSVVLADLMVRHGKKIAPKGRIKLLHCNHGWRGVESDLDEASVVALGARLGVPVEVVNLKEAAKAKKGESWEDSARRARNQVFQERVSRGGAFVFTAHQANDLAETVLWRLCTGQRARQKAGILPFISGSTPSKGEDRSGGILRPILFATRARLLSYAKEEALSWRKDASNFDPRFLRARLRKEVFPALESIFSNVINNLAQDALSSLTLPRIASLPLTLQRENRDHLDIRELFRNSGLLRSFNLRSSQWAEITKQLKTRDSVQLSQGWSLKRERKA